MLSFRHCTNGTSSTTKAESEAAAEAVTEVWWKVRLRRRIALVIWWNSRLSWPVSYTFSEIELFSFVLATFEKLGKLAAAARLRCHLWSYIGASNYSSQKTQHRVEYVIISTHSI